jgi:hypothetical protein
MTLPPRRTRILAGIAMTVALAAVAAAPASAAPGPKQPASVLVGLLIPFADRTERGVVMLSVRPAGSSIAVSGTYEPGEYTLLLSKRSCASLESDPSSPPRLIRPALIGPKAFMGTTFDDEAIRDVPKRDVRAAKSFVLVARGASGKFEPRACGVAYRLEDVLISSLMEHEGIWYGRTAAR